MTNDEKISGLQKIFLSQFQQSATNIELLNSENFWADFYKLLTNPNDNSDEIVSLLNKLGIADIDAVYSQCIAFKENYVRNNDSQFEKDAKSAFTIFERKSLKEKLALTDELLQFELTDQEIISAFNIQKKNERIEWKKKFAEWDKETISEKTVKKGKVVSFAFIKYAVAACVIGALVWVGIEVNKNNTTNFANNKIDTTHQIIKPIEKPQFANAVVIKQSRNLIQEQNIGYAPTSAKEIKIEVTELQNRITSIENFVNKNSTSSIVSYFDNKIRLLDKNALSQKHNNGFISTIDSELQTSSEELLKNTLKKYEAEHGTVILMEVKTGKIKALANLGHVKTDKPYSEGMNYAISESIEPGSTFQLMTCAALLESGLADTSTMIDLEHGHKIYGSQIMKDHELAVNYGSLKTAFTISSNVGISKFAYNAFNDKQEMYTNYLKQFGLMSKTGIDLSGEVNPDVKEANSKRWNKSVSLPWMSVGYEERLTPLQVLCFYNSIANNGIRNKPYIVKSLNIHDTNILSSNLSVNGQKILTDFTAGKLKRLMEEAVKCQIDKTTILNTKYSIAGKAGTAQIFEAGSGGFNNKGSGSKKIITSFVGYFPADNPKYSCIVVINNPKKYSSIDSLSQIAFYPFKELANKIYDIKHSTRDLSVISNELDSLYKITNTYIFDGIKIQLFLKNNQSEKIAVIKTNTNHYYLKENEAYFEIIKTSKNLPLIPVTDKAIINKIERIEFDNEK